MREESLARYVSFGWDIELVTSMSESVIGVKLNGAVPTGSIGRVTHDQDQIYRLINSEIYDLLNTGMRQ